MHVKVGSIKLGERRKEMNILRKKRIERLERELEAFKKKKASCRKS
jgi:hypothetical protein